VITKLAILSLMIVALALSLSAAASQGREAGGAKKTYVVLSATDNETRISLKVSELLLVVLPAQPGTGCTWRAIRSGKPLGTVEKLNFNQVQELMKAGALPSASEEGSPGSTERQVFRLSPVGKGNTTLELHYVCVWEPNKVAKKFRVTLQVS